MLNAKYKKLRIAQDLPASVIKKISYACMEMQKGSYKHPEKEYVFRFINELARDRKIHHYRLIGKDGNEIFLFDADEVLDDFEIVEVDAPKITSVIKIQCYGKEVSHDDRIPIQISNIDGLYKIPRTTFSSGTCVYFLCRDGKVVYVGQAENVHKRIVEHVKTKIFDDVFYIRVPGHQMTKVESSLIAYLKPEYNKAVPTLTNSRKDYACGILAKGHLI